MFKNPLHIIVQEIARAHKLYSSHPASQLQQVFVCVFSSTMFQEVRDLLCKELQVKSETESETESESKNIK